MANFQQQLTKAKKLSPNRLEKDLFKFIKSIEKEILEKNKYQIQEQSQDIYGNPIGFYSYATEVISKGKKKKGEPFTGYDTGDLLNKSYLQEVAGVIRFGSNSPHWAEIQKSSGIWLSKELFGLSDQNLKEVIQERLLPFFIENSSNILEI